MKRRPAWPKVTRREMERKKLGDEEEKGTDSAKELLGQKSV
jgi:hypothetical protein